MSNQSNNPNFYEGHGLRIFKGANIKDGTWNLIILITFLFIRSKYMIWHKSEEKYYINNKKYRNTAELKI